MNQLVAFASVTPRGTIREFEILKASLEMFETGAGGRWITAVDDDGKINAIEAAQRAHSPDAVIYLDPGIVITAPFLAHVLGIGGDVVLSPHYCPASRAAEEQVLGTYSTAFLLVRNPAFPAWWRSAASQNGMTDQRALNEASQHFRVGILGPSANIGFWRGGPSLEFPQIPSDCLFFNVPLFQPHLTAAALVKKVFATSLTFGLSGGQYRPAFSGVELTDKAFALHCLRFLRSTGATQHKELLSRILSLDELELYAAELAT